MPSWHNPTEATNALCGRGRAVTSLDVGFDFVLTEWQFIGIVRDRCFQMAQIFRPAHPRNFTRGQVALPSANGLFEFRREFQIVLDHIVEPFADLMKLRLRQFAKLGFHLLDFAHEVIMQSACRECKNPRSGDLKSPTKKTAIENRRSLRLSLKPRLLWSAVVNRLSLM
jgi:hypothetical protein